MADSYLYTAYGEPVASTGADRNPGRCGGQFGYYSQPGAGIVLCGARWYNPYTARWMTRDPIGYAGGENLYRYCGESPVVELPAAHAPIRFMAPRRVPRPSHHGRFPASGGE